MDSPERWEKSLKLSGLFVMVAFAVGYMVGLLGALASPGDGWASWRVGLLVGVIFAAVAFIASVIATAMYVSDI